MIKFPSIEQFRNVIKEVRLNHDYKGKDENDKPIYLNSSPYPTLTFRGTVKLHGTNSAIVKYKDGRVEFQSRERVLTLQQDNAQFMLNMMNKDLDFLFDGIEFEDYIAIYGEWCGQGIQKGVAISEIEKSFFIFATSIDHKWTNILRTDHTQRIYDIKNFQTYSIEIDFNYPKLSQNKLQELTLEVEKECPVGRSFGVSGIGEGIVWASRDRKYVFKVKGEKHSVTKVKTLASVDIEVINSMNSFIEYACTEERLKQGIQYLKENNLDLELTSLGAFLKWVVNDIRKEEADTMKKNNLNKNVYPLISKKARMWFNNHILPY